ncbi:MAG: YfhO family protein [Acidobacteriota bacterium]
MIAGVFTVALYVLVAAGCIWLAGRFVNTVSRKAAIVLVLVPMAFTGRALFTGAVYAPIDLLYDAPPFQGMRHTLGVPPTQNPMLSDVYCLTIPWIAAVRQAYGEGRLPLWNPSMLAGDILAAGAQPTPYHPLFLTSFLLPLANSITYLATLTLFLTGLMAFLFLRELELSEEAAMAGAAGWAFCTCMVFWLEWPVTSTMLWAPLAFLAVRRCVRNPGRGGLWLLTVSFVMTILSGHPESSLHIVSGCGVVLLAELVTQPERRVVRSVLRCVAAGLLALLITAFYLLPIAEAIPQTFEYSFRRAVYVSSPNRSASPALLQSRILQTFVPFLYGSPQRELAKNPPQPHLPDSGYPGSILFAPAIYAVFRWRSRDRGPLILLAALGFIFGLEVPPTGDFLARLPLFDVAINTRMSFIGAFAFIALAAAGVDQWMKDRDDRTLALIAAITTALLAALTATQAPLMTNLGLSNGFISRSATALIAPPLISAAIFFFMKQRRTAAWLFLLLLIAQRTWEEGSLYPTLPPRAFYPPVAGFDALPKGGPPYRIAGLGYTLIPNGATLYGLEDVRGYTAMTFAPLQETFPLWSYHQDVWFNRIDNLELPFLSFLNVRYAVEDPSAPVPRSWNVVADTPQMRLLENPLVLPRAFVPRHVRINVPRSSEVGEMALQNDFSDLGWISHPGGGQSPGTLENGPGSVALKRVEPGDFSLNVHMERPGWVIVSESAWWGWKAVSDGKRIPIRFANHAFVGFHLNEGDHLVRLRYRPRSFEVGGVVSLLTVLAIAGTGWVLRRRADGQI